MFRESRLLFSHLIVKLVALCLLLSFPLSADLYSYLIQTGLPITSIIPIHTNGATDCSYYIIDTKYLKYFVKTGEKVDKEIKNITFLRKNSVTCIPNLSSTTSYENKILITDFISHSDYGLRMVNAFHSGQISTENFLNFQSQALGLLKEFYRITPPENETTCSGVFSGRINQRIQDLLANQDEIMTPTDNGELTLRSMLNAPIEYRDHKSSYHLPCLLEIAEEFSSMLKQLPELRKYVLHGDFHAPNICMNDDSQLVLVDLSDVMLQEEPVWDLGKWLNHFTRLYRVVNERTKDKPDSLISFSFVDSCIRIEDRHIGPLTDDIRKEAIRTFALLIDEERELIDVKSRAAECIVNFSTLRRHMLRFPDSARGVLVSIIDSYLAFKQCFEKYQKATECSFSLHKLNLPQS